MEQQLAKTVQEIESQREPKNLLPALPANLLPEEANILAVKYQSTQFGRMGADEVDLWADALLLKIHAITGWTVPEQTLLTIFTDQFRKKISESYANTNPDEIEFAFRNYGTVVADWGKQMNLSMIDQVMIPYLSRRAELSKLEEQKVPPAAITAPEEDLSDQAMTDWLNFTRSRAKAGKLTVNFIPLGLYEWLDKRGEIKATASEKYEYLARAADYRQGQLIELINNENSLANRNKLTAFMVMKQEKAMTGEEIDIVRNLAKKMILFDMIKK